MWRRHARSPGRAFGSKIRCPLRMRGLESDRTSASTRRVRSSPALWTVFRHNSSRHTRSDPCGSECGVILVVQSKTGTKLQISQSLLWKAWK